MTISERIFHILREQGKKQKDLALYTRLSTSAISDWKKKGTNPSSEYISDIADFLGVSTDYLLTGTDKNISKIVEKEKNLNADEDLLLNLYRESTEDGKKLILNTVKNLWADNRYPKSKSSDSPTDEISVTA